MIYQKAKERISKAAEQGDEDVVFNIGSLLQRSTRKSLSGV